MGQTSSGGDTTVHLSVGGFVDAYYAWDFDRPRTFDRAYTTQPSRHAEANVNLAFVEARVTGPRYRGRLALQWGTSVQSNYAAEPRIGTISGPEVSRFIQEAVAGYQLAPTLWVDGGIFLSHVGQEGWISRDNLTYTRSLIADYSPYYESGAKLTWTATPKLTATVVVVNGWQNISAENSTPGGGLRLDYALTPRLTLTYDDYIGNAAPDSLPQQLRVYHDVVAQVNPSAQWQLSAVYSIGSQTKSASAGGAATWWGGSLIARYHPTSRTAIVGRVEHYADPSQVIVTTGTPRAFRTNGASLGADMSLTAALLWRTELRALRSTQPVWPLHAAGGLGRDDSFLVTSLALTF